MSKYSSNSPCVCNREESTRTNDQRDTSHPVQGRTRYEFPAACHDSSPESYRLEQLQPETSRGRECSLQGLVITITPLSTRRALPMLCHVPDTYMRCGANTAVVRPLCGLRANGLAKVEQVRTAHLRKFINFINVLTDFWVVLSDGAIDQLQWSGIHFPCLPPGNQK